MADYFWGGWCQKLLQGVNITWGYPKWRALFSHHYAAGFCHKIGLLVLLALSRRGVVIGS